MRGWTLAPAYDLNPMPTDVAPRILATAIHFDDATTSLALALEVAPYFELDASSAQATIAFEHADLELAQRLQVDGM